MIVGRAGVGLVLAAVAGTVIVRRSLRAAGPGGRHGPPGRRAAARPGRGRPRRARARPRTPTPAPRSARSAPRSTRCSSHVGDALNARQQSETRVRQFVADASHELRTPLASIRGYAELTRRETRAGARRRRPRHRPGRVRGAADDRPRRGPAAAGPARLRPAARPRAGRPVAARGRRRERRPRRRRPTTAGSSTCPRSRSRSPATAPGCTRSWPTCWRTPAPTPRPARTVTVRLRPRRPRGAVSRSPTTAPASPRRCSRDVFERFARGDHSRSRAAGSTGLGLAIVAAVVEAHGGTVDVDEPPGRHGLHGDAAVHSRRTGRTHGRHSGIGTAPMTLTEDQPLAPAAAARQRGPKASRPMRRSPRSTRPPP